MLRQVFSRIWTYRSVSDITTATDILQSITWVATLWKEVLEVTIENNEEDDKEALVQVTLIEAIELCIAKSMWMVWLK